MTIYIGYILCNIFQKFALVLNRKHAVGNKQLTLYLFSYGVSYKNTNTLQCVHDIFFAG